MIKRVLIGILLLLIPFMMGILFLLIGATIGGNFFVNFEAFGVRGYEATGMVGLYVGIIIGIVVSINVLKKLNKDKEKSVD